MRDYTYIDGTRFSISNLFRSLRFDVDRLDPSWVDEEKPTFIRGLRIVDNDDMETLTAHGEDADNLMFSLTYLYSRNDDFEKFRTAMDDYLKAIFETKEYLVSKKNINLTEQTGNQEALEVTEILLH
jgi:hypothetical protein